MLHELKRKSFVLIMTRSRPSLLGKQLRQDPGIKPDLMKRDLKRIGINIKSRAIFE